MHHKDIKYLLEMRNKKRMGMVVPKRAKRSKRQETLGNQRDQETLLLWYVCLKQSEH